MATLARLVRSPRVAVWLIVALSVYVGLVTAIPQESMLPDRHAAWVAEGSPLVSVARAVGADRAYTNPLFLLIAAALTLSTGVCAWDRSRRALRTWRERGMVTEALRARLDARPDAEATVDMDVEMAQEKAARALEGLHLKARRGPSLMYAEAGAWGLLGSPLFHWSMVVLVVVVGLGQLTRWEGLLGVPSTGTVVEEAGSYREFDSGSLALPHTGWSLSIASVDESKSIGDVYYGVTPRITLSDGERVLAEQEVHPNRPLRYGPLLVHLSDYGLAVRVKAIGPDGESSGTSNQIIDFDEMTESGTVPSQFAVIDDAGITVAEVAVAVSARDRAGALPRMKPPGKVILIDSVLSDGSKTSVRVAVGEPVELGGGWTIVAEEMGYYARLSVVRDWSVYWIYGLLGLITVGVIIALGVPYRFVWVRSVADPDGGSRVAVVTGQSRRDPVFRSRVTDALAAMPARRASPADPKPERDDDVMEDE
ncbi:MAG: cytochrome c biogenesis protein ResB [Coriobacteriia bacterium]|nr:cytochrome c biogenesis protein ResB [Coriobacteriia bacterium]